MPLDMANITVERAYDNGGETADRYAPVRRGRRVRAHLGAPIPLGALPREERFTLTIEMGNAAMATREDIARALRAVAEKLDGGRDGGFVRDDNGNTVGQYELGGNQP